MEDYKSCYAG